MTLAMPQRVSLTVTTVLDFCTDVLRLHLLQVLIKLNFTVKVVYRAEVDYE
jgi:hypothetical protein